MTEIVWGGTPGPWWLGSIDDGWLNIDSSDWDWLAQVPVIVDGKPDIDGQTNARAIAEVPAMVNLLRRLASGVCKKADKLEIMDILGRIDNA